MGKANDQSIEKFLSLLGSSPSYMSGQILAKSAGISRSAVWKQIRRLRRLGYSIESVHGLGYRLKGGTQLPVPWELKKALRTRRLGHKILYKDVVDSTQNIAIAIAEKGSGTHGTVVIAEKQKQGRGRLKREWLSPSGGLWMSVIVEPDVPTGIVTLLPFVAALSVCHAIRQCTGLDAKLKWPNDVMISGKKVAGILLDISAEAEHVNYSVIGIGINANIDSASVSARVSGGAPRITSISEQLGHDVSKLELARTILELLERRLSDLNDEGARVILKEWESNTDMLGRQVKVLQDGKVVCQGVARGLADDGSLIIQDGSREVKVASGDIRVRY
jgi:BirA family biotin operon repressor/biotin-[acetyl-CoA-carboxylase] ligase